VSAGGANTMAIKTDSSLWAWGSVGYGNIGDGNASGRLSPVKIMDDVSAVSAGSYHSMAVKTDGTLWVWGWNYYGQIGSGTGKDNHLPVKIMDNVSTVAAGGWHFSLAVKTDGSLWAWGSNEYGQLGNGTTEDKGTPIKIMDNVNAVFTGTYHAMAIKTDGSLWAWGSNDIYQLGDGTTIDKYVPVKVMDGVMLSSEILTPLPTPQTAIPTTSTVLIDGKQVSFDAYNINNNNYFKLRDIAMALNGTAKQFEVEWDAANNIISVTSDSAYTAVGGELAKGIAGNKQANLTTSKIYLDGKEVRFTAYNINSNNYFKLRDIGKALDFGVSWDGPNNTIIINISTVYTE